jgi:putative Mg2+ transporter-C (MgtC) family protein
MLTSLHVFDIYKGSASVDPARIAAGVMTGIGFLGAGAIIRSGEAVRGLTTAAGIWLVAGIGLGIGCGFYLASLITAFLAIIVLYFLRYLEEAINK